MQKICGFRWNFTYIPSAMSGLSVSASRPPFWFPVELASNYAQGDVAISNGDFGILKNKRSNVEFASKVDLLPLIQWSPSISHFHQQIWTPWRNSIIGWTISKVSPSFYHALMVLGIRRSAMRNSENSDGQLRYSRKTRGAAFASGLEAEGLASIGSLEAAEVPHRPRLDVLMPRLGIMLCPLSYVTISLFITFLHSSFLYRLCA